METVCFELNNWFPGSDYPDDEPFSSWMKDDSDIAFRNEAWVRENRLCVVFSTIDMSQNFCITATKEWVEDNCPRLLTDHAGFLRYPDPQGDVFGTFGDEFLRYDEGNIGITEPCYGD